MPKGRAVRFLSILLTCALICVVAGAQDWIAPTPEELHMTSEAKAPGAPAIFLYRQVDRNDNDGTEYNYARIKVLNDEGRKYGDVEIPFDKESTKIDNLHARVIKPDGTIVNFEGKVYEKTIVKAKGISFLAKTFTLPEVQPGSIVEYRYYENLDPQKIYDSHWILSQDLFTKRAVFSLRPYKEFSLRWAWPSGLPEGTIPPKDENGMIRLEAHDIPAFQVEDYMPPEDELKYRVDFIYSTEPVLEKVPEKYWKQEGKRLFDQVNDLVDKRKAMEQAVAQIISPSDTPEQKLRKIYTRCQQLHNTSYEVQKTEQQEKREQIKENKNVEDVWRNGRGSGIDITWLFLALARAAGFEADPVMVSARNAYFFNQRYMNSRQLNSNVVSVTLNGNKVYFDPGQAFAPFGMLPWYETGVQGLLLNKDGGSWLTTPLPLASDSRIDRKADLRIVPETGGLDGTVTITFTGLAALSRRLEERNDDAVDRKEYLENQLKEYVPAAAEVELTNSPDWSGSDAPLVANYKLKVPGWMTSAGHRALLQMGLFSGSEKNVFEHANRIHPIYFQYPYQANDDITLHLPLGWSADSLPPPTKVEAKVVGYSMTAEADEGALHLKRQLMNGLLFLETKGYGALQDFYRQVRTGDEQQIVVSTAAKTAHN